MTLTDVNVANTHNKIDGISIAPFFPVSSQLLTHIETILSIF